MNQKTRKKVIKYLKSIRNVFIFAAICVAYSFAEPYLLETKTTVIHNSDVPQNFTGKKIVFISDIHHDKFFSRERIAEIVKMANDANPDIIILGGDYVSGNKEYVEPCFEELSKLKAPLGVYGVTGNHDSDTSYRMVVKYMKAAGITPLENSAKWIEIDGEKIKLGGVATSYGEESIATSTINGTHPEDFVLLVSHNPDFAEELQTNNIDLMLSGHTHGGQVTLFGLWAPYVPSDYGLKYMKGIVKTPHTTVFVSNGVGTSFLPMRFFARPQINVIVLEK